MKKLGFVVTAHWSDAFRPNGKELISNFCESLNLVCKYDFNLYVIDNGSQEALTLDYNNVKVIRIDDQMLEGITGAWNVGIYQAYKDGCNIIFNCSDDMWFNDTINTFIEFIDIHDSDDFIYSTLTDGVLGGIQLANGPDSRENNIISHCSGFFFAMTRNHYEKYRYSDIQYFNRNNKHNGGDGKWGGQEGQFIENHEKGANCIIVRNCWLPHIKVRGWTKLRGK